MKIPAKFKEAALAELGFIISKSKDTKDPERLLYYFSGAYGFINRILNFEFHSSLCLIHMVLQNTHQTFIGRLKAIQQGDRAYPLLDVQFEKLIQLTEAMAEKIQRNESLQGIVEDFSALSYSAGGNGNFLMEKGMLKLSDDSAEAKVESEDTGKA